MSRPAGGPCCQPIEGGVRLFVRVSPRASRDRIEVVERDAAGQERLRIRVTAPPDVGAANDRVTLLIAKALHIAKSAITLRQGAQDRNKSFEISGDTQHLMAAIAALGEEQ
jgi:uncharacterized protein